MPETMDVLARAREWLRLHAEEMADDLCEFVRIRSVSRADLALPGAPFGAEVQQMLEFALLRGAAYGFETTNADGFYGKITLGDDDDSIGVIAHLDVVPEGVNWTRPPFAAVREGEFIFGRGASDNKSALVAGLYVMRMAKELRLPLKHGLRLILGTSEETGMQDMVAYNQREKPCKVTLVADSAFPVCYAQKGSLTAHVSIPMGAQIISFEGGEVDNMVPPVCECVLAIDADDARNALPPEIQVERGADGFAKVTARGAAAHAASPADGVSAIQLLTKALAASGLIEGDSLKAISAIEFLSQGYYGEHAGIACEDEHSGKTTMVVGIARSRGGEIEAHIDCRLSIKADIDAARAAMRSAVEARGFELKHMHTTPHVYISKDDERVRALQAVYAGITGDEREPYTMGGGTYSRCLKDAITYGLSLPGRKTRPDDLPEGRGGAHMPDECVHLPSLIEATHVLLMSVLALDAL